MSDYAINPERGEVAVTLDGIVYPMWPSYQAQSAIESQTGVSIEEMMVRSRRLGGALSDQNIGPGAIGLTAFELATVVCETIRAAGKQRQDKELAAFNVDRCGELIVKDRSGVHRAVALLLRNCVFGGADEEKKDPSTPPPNPGPVGS